MVTREADPLYVPPSAGSISLLARNEVLSSNNRLGGKLSINSTASAAATGSKPLLTSKRSLSLKASAPVAGISSSSCIRVILGIPGCGPG